MQRRQSEQKLQKTEVQVINWLERVFGSFDTEKETNKSSGLSILAFIEEGPREVEKWSQLSRGKQTLQDTDKDEESWYTGG